MHYNKINSKGLDPKEAESAVFFIIILCGNCCIFDKHLNITLLCSIIDMFNKMISRVGHKFHITWSLTYSNNAKILANSKINNAVNIFLYTMDVPKSKSNYITDTIHPLSFTKHLLYK